VRLFLIAPRRSLVAMALSRNFFTRDIGLLHNIYKSRIGCSVMKSKRGAAHIEMITAFILFISFVFFLFIVLRPYEVDTLSGSVIAAVHDSFREEVLTNLTSVFLGVTDGNLQDIPGENDCFYVELNQQIFVYTLSDSFVTFVGGVPVDSNLEATDAGGDLNVKDKVDGSYRVLISPEFNSSDVPNCGDMSKYVLGSLLERQVVSMDALQAMGEEYYGDSAGYNYESLRAKLRVPETFDFAILSEDIPSINMQNVISDSGDVLAQEYVMEVLDDDGTVINAKFIFKIW